MADNDFVERKLARIMRARRESLGDQAPQRLHRSEGKLGASQIQIWRAGQRFPKSVAQNVHFARQLRGEIKLSALKNAVSMLCERHEAFRTLFVRSQTPGSAAEVRQRVLSRTRLELEFSDLTEKLDKGPSIALDDLQRATAFASLDAASGDMARVHLVRLSRDEYLLLFTMHHLIADGWSKDIVLHDLFTLYEQALGKRLSEQPELSVQPLDAYQWKEEKSLVSERQRVSEHWVSYLSGTKGNLQLPVCPDSETTRITDTVGLPEGAGKVVRFELTADLTSEIQAFCREEDITPYVFLLSAVCTTLFHYGNDQEVVVGCPIAQRDHKSIEDLVGCFMKVSALRFKIVAQQSLRELLNVVKKDVLMALDNQNYDLSEVLQELHVEAPPDRSSLFQTIVQFKRFATKPLDVDSIEVKKVLSRHLSAPVDLAFEWDLETDSFGCNLIFDISLLNEPLVQSIGSDVEAVIRTIVDKTKSPGELLVQACSPTRHVQGTAFYETLNRPDKPFRAKNVMEHLQTYVASTPSQVALLPDSGSPLSYLQMWEKVSTIAGYLFDQGVTSGDTVLIQLRSRLDAIVAMFGVLKANAAYLVVNDALPQQQKDEILRVVNPICHISESGITRTDLPRKQAATMLPGTSEDATQERSEANQIAYIMATSGSTGTPKLVPISQAALVNLVEATQELVPLDTTDRMLQFSPLFSDFSVEEVFTTLCSGATLAVPDEQPLDPEDFLRTVDAFAITQLTLPTSYFRTLVHSGVAERLSSNVRAVRLGGEAVQKPTLSQWWQQTNDRIRLFNTYGPTETTVQSLACELLSTDTTIPLGKSLKNYRHYVLDPSGEICPAGVPGQLYIAGIGVSSGYLNHDNAGQFVAASDLCGVPQGESRLFRTGDRCYVDLSGVVHFLSRIDRTVKIRGYAVDLDAVAGVIAEHPAVRGAIVDRDENHERFIAWFETHPDKKVTRAELQRFLAERVANYALPTGFECIESWPITAAGKIDQNALWKGLPDQVAVGELPREGTEALMADIWCSVLGLERVFRDDGFLQLGGDSIQAAQVLNLLAKTQPDVLSVATLFEPLSLAELSLLLELAQDRS